MSRPAFIVAAIYFVITSGIAIKTALEPRSAWSSLQQIYTFIATSPVSVPLAMLGHEPDLSNHLTATLTVLSATAVVYGFVAVIVWIFSRF